MVVHRFAHRCGPGADQGYHGPGRLRSSALTVCSARGWDREVERHQGTRQRLLQLLEQLGGSETR
jgi:hypothetical protein